MQLTKPEIDEINRLLKDSTIILPDFRRTITATGQNTQWLKKNIHARNPHLPARLTELLAKL